jgi:hypothetical protein
MAPRDHKLLVSLLKRAQQARKKPLHGGFSFNLY